MPPLSSDTPKDWRALRGVFSALRRPSVEFSRLQRFMAGWCILWSWILPPICVGYDWYITYKRSIFGRFPNFVWVWRPSYGLPMEFLVCFRKHEHPKMRVVRTWFMWWSQMWPKIHRPVCFPWTPLLLRSVAIDGSWHTKNNLGHRGMFFGAALWHWKWNVPANRCK